MKTGILLCNLGTPAEPTPPAIRRWLAEFLHDYRVVDMNRWLWCPILHFFILPLRPRKLAHAYASIWTPEGSPLLSISRQQRAALANDLGTGHAVALGMRYGEPTVAQGLRELMDAGAERIIVLPLYPQFSGTTTESVRDALKAAVTALTCSRPVEFVEDYYQHTAYLAALENSVRAHWHHHGRGDHLLLSLHGIPQRYVDAGDPYARQCQTTAEKLTDSLELDRASWTLAYQSRVGREQWLQPYTDETVIALAQRGIKTLDVLCPGFSADCLETLEEVQQRYGELFHQHGGQVLRYIPALNASADHIQMMRGVLAPILDR